MTTRLLYLFMFTLAVSGCTDSPTAPTDITGTAWSLVSLQQSGASPIVVDAPSRYTVSFGDDGRVSVKSDCNSCGGTYTLTGSALAVQPLACTKVACPNGSLDQVYTAAIERAASIARDGDDLTVESGGATLRFRR